MIRRSWITNRIEFYAVAWSELNVKIKRIIRSKVYNSGSLRHSREIEANFFETRSPLLSRGARPKPASTKRISRALCQKI